MRRCRPLATGVRTASSAAAGPATASEDSGLDLSWPSASDRTHSRAACRPTRSLPFVGHGRTRSHPRSRSRRPRRVGRQRRAAELCRERARRNAGGARCRTAARSTTRSSTPCARRPPTRYQANSSAFLEIAESKLTGYVRPAEGVAREGRRPGRTLELAQGAGVRRTREPAVAAERADRNPRDGAADAARQGTLGRDSAQARRRACGHAAVLRLRRAGHGLDRRWTAAPRSDRPSPGREGRDRRRQGSARGIPRRLRGDRRRRAHASPRIARPPGARPHGEAQRQELLAAVRRHARLRRDVPSRRGFLPRSLGAGSLAGRDGCSVACARCLADDAHRPAPVDRRTAGSRRASQRTRARSSRWDASSTSASASWAVT